MATQISKKRKFVADGVFKAELNEFLMRELCEDGYSGVEVRVTPTRTELIILATRTQEVLGEKGRRIRELTALVQKRFNFAKDSVEVHTCFGFVRLCYTACVQPWLYFLFRQRWWCVCVWYVCVCVGGGGGGGGGGREEDCPPPKWLLPALRCNCVATSVLLCSCAVMQRQGWLWCCDERPSSCCGRPPWRRGGLLWTFKGNASLCTWR